MLLECTINGCDVRLEVPSDRRVVDILREDLKLTAAKEACGSGECGACSILVDGEARLSCLTLAIQIQGRSLTTPEGLGTPTSPHPVQKALAEHGAVQCGFCTPGVSISAAELLSRVPDPSEAQVREALSGHLCRCTGYQLITKAVLAAANDKQSGESTS